MRSAAENTSHISVGIESDWKKVDSLRRTGQVQLPYLLGILLVLFQLRAMGHKVPKSLERNLQCVRLDKQTMQCTDFCE